MNATTPITLRVSSQEFIELSNVQRFSDGSGYASQLAIGSGLFACLGHPFYFDDLSGFIKDVTRAYNRLEGKARLGSLYEKDFVGIQVLTRGRVSVFGTICQHGTPRQELNFAFECDQTFLQPLLSSLMRVTKELEGKASKR